MSFTENFTRKHFGGTGEEVMFTHKAHPLEEPKAPLWWYQHRARPLPGIPVLQEKVRNSHVPLPGGNSHHSYHKFQQSTDPQHCWASVTISLFHKKVKLKKPHAAETMFNLAKIMIT